MHTEENSIDIENFPPEDDFDLLNAGNYVENDSSDSKSESDNDTNNDKDNLLDNINTKQFEEWFSKLNDYFESQTNNNSLEIDNLVRELVDMMIKNDKLSKEECDSSIEKLADAYEKGYRHSYSIIAEQMYDSISNETNNTKNLQNNIEVFISFLARKELSEVQSRGFDKLRDHIKLEALRIENNNKIVSNAKNDIVKLSENVKQNIEDSSKEIVDNFKKETNAIVEDIKNIQEETNKTIAEIGKTQRKADKINDRMETIYSEYISILGIFAAVVLVFFGGSSIFSGIFTQIKDASIWKIGFAGSLAGIVIFNVIFMFLYIISKIVKRPICSEEDMNPKMFYPIRIAKKYPYMFWFNILMLIIFMFCA